MSFIQPNDRFVLTNVEAGTCMDLSGGDNRSIIGYGFHGGPNQEWIFEDAGRDRLFYIKSSGSGQFLSVAGVPSDGQKLVADGSPFPWRVKDAPGQDGAVIVLVPETPFCVDLSDHGNPTPGTPVQLWSDWQGPNQVWKLRKV